MSKNVYSRSKPIVEKLRKEKVRRVIKLKEINYVEGTNISEPGVIPG